MPFDQSRGKARSTRHGRCSIPFPPSDGHRTAVTDTLARLSVNLLVLEQKEEFFLSNDSTYPGGADPLTARPRPHRGATPKAKHLEKANSESADTTPHPGTSGSLSGQCVCMWTPSETLRERNTASVTWGWGHLGAVSELPAQRPEGTQVTQ